MTEASRDEARRVELGLQADREMEAFAAEAAAAKDSDMVSWQESVEGRMEGLKGRSQGTKSLSAASGKIDIELKRLDEEEAADFSKQAHPRRPIRAEIKGQPGRTELMATGVTLLNREDYEECRELIPPAGGRSWWLRSPGSYGNMASFVGYDGDVDEIGLHVDFTESVRPALTFDPGASGLAPGDRFNALSQDWTMISDRLALCDSCMGKMCFNKNMFAPDAEEYCKSDIKPSIEKWLEDRMQQEGDAVQEKERHVPYMRCDGSYPGLPPCPANAGRKQEIEL